MWKDWKDGKEGKRSGYKRWGRLRRGWRRKELPEKEGIARSEKYELNRAFGIQREPASRIDLSNGPQ
jgi:hypothetical protein